MIKEIGVTGFEPATLRPPAECAKPGYATPRKIERVNIHDKRARWQEILLNNFRR